MQGETGPDNFGVRVANKLSDQDVFANERGCNSMETEEQQREHNVCNNENGIATSSPSDDVEMVETLKGFETSMENEEQERVVKCTNTFVVEQGESMVNVVQKMNTMAEYDGSTMKNNENVTDTDASIENDDSTMENGQRVKDTNISIIMEHESLENEEEMDTYGFDEMAVKDSRYTKDTMIKVATGKGVTMTDLTLNNDSADEEFKGFPASELRTTNLKHSLMNDAVALVSSETSSYRRNKKQSSLSVSNSSSGSTSSDNSVYDERVNDNNQYVKQYSGKELSNKKKQYLAHSSRMSITDNESSSPAAEQQSTSSSVGNNHASGKPLVTSVTNPLEAWSRFITDSILHRIAQDMNAIISCRKFRCFAETVKTNASELKAFFGILYMTSWLQKCGFTTQSAFSDRGLGMDFILACMPYKRFYFLLSILMVAPRKASDENNADSDDGEEQLELENKKWQHRFLAKEKDPLESVRWLLNEFLNCCRSNYRPGEKLMVRELSRSFRGKCDFVKHRHKEKGKKVKSCMKLLVAIDPTDGYVYNAVVRTEKEVHESEKALEAVTRNVLELMEPIKHTERVVFTDARISSVSICVDLLNRHGLRTIGMIQKQRVLQAVERNSIDASTLTAYNSKFVSSHTIGVTFVSYNARKNRTVFAVSTVNSGKRVEPHSGVLKRPVIVGDYDRTLNRVRELEKQFAPGRLTKASNWQSGLLFGLLEIAAVNSYVLFFHCRKNGTPFVEYFQNLILSLAEDFMSKRLVYKKTEILDGGTASRLKRLTGTTGAISNSNDVVTMVNGDCRDHFDQSGGPCEMCCYTRNGDKSEYRCTKCDKLICSEHSIVLCKHCNDCVLSSPSDDDDDDDDSIMQNDVKQDGSDSDNDW